MKRVVSIVVVIAAIVGGFFLWKGLSGRKSNIAPYRMGVVDRGSVKVVVSATGTASAVTTVQVGSQVSGTIKEILVDFNSPVKRGQVIARLDPTFLEAAVRESEANLERARAALKQAERDVERVKDLFEKNLTPRVDYDNALTTMDQARAGVQQAEAQVQRARVNLAYSVITSPIDGVVISRNVDVGQTVAASLSAPTLFTIAQDLRQMQIEINIDEADIGGLRDEMDATFTVDSYPDDVFHGKIRQIRYAAKTEQSVVTYPVILTVDNPDLKLRPGMTANVSVVTAQKDDVLRVPTTALRFRPAENASSPNGVAARSERTGGTGGQGGQGREWKGKKERESEPARAGKEATVYTKGADGKPKLMRIRVGLNDGGFAEVLEADLQPGDSVIVGMAGTSAVGVRTMPGMGGGMVPRGGR